jgi:N-acetylmuramoyl-L-alanine amidase
MIVLLKKSNILLILLVFVLVASIFSLNFGDEEWVFVTKDADKKVVIIDAGHGGEDPGKVSSYSGLKEKDLNLIVAEKTKKLLEEEGLYEVVMTREEDVLVYEEGTAEIYEKRKQDLTRRKEIMDQYQQKGIVISIHANSFPETKYYGAQTFYPPDSPESKKLAEVLQQSLREHLDPDNKRQPQLKKERIVILRDLKTPTVIIETGFLSNEAEEAKLATDEYQSKLAEAIVKGINQYYKD